MKWLAAFKSSLVLVAVVLLNTVGLATHVSAMSTMSHEMSGMSHQTGDTSNCATLCRNAVLERDVNQPQQNDKQDNEDEFAEPSAPQKPLLTDAKSLKQRLYADNLKPPPKIPIYILYQVFRT